MNKKMQEFSYKVSVFMFALSMVIAIGGGFALIVRFTVMK